ncbi:PR domain zinc finger protein 16 [Gracilariopsis chorda]|uniref:PR domain zinc finger protein 16 n=1 Tax=Gracilariopsis chorda TaxID=448386 RepID=A0A2V3IPE2_9FLOR|nr:PR domain zinc finger protein 16 [Gracilariopsis chorda]|eukprot:PXF43934.1 PR domain zinc finger protein 16 [Gracilariopsis chorda]
MAPPKPQRAQPDRSRAAGPSSSHPRRRSLDQARAPDRPAPMEGVSTPSSRHFQSMADLGRASRSARSRAPKPSETRRQPSQPPPVTHHAAASSSLSPSPMAVDYPPDSKHSKRTKKGDRPFLCDLCPSAFESSASRNTHRDSVHNKKRDHECAVCHRKFGERSNKTKHLTSRPPHLAQLQERSRRQKGSSMSYVR